MRMPTNQGATQRKLVRECGARTRLRYGAGQLAARMHSHLAQRLYAELFVKRLFLFALIIAIASPLTAGSEEKFTVSGFGGYPISGSLTSMWLLGPDHRPLLMVYFHGPDGWHNTQWKVASKFEKGKPGWAELRSERATLHLSMNTETGDAGVQSANFKISENNTFLVLHTGDTSIPQKIIPLGVFDLPPSKEQPAAVMLLRANSALIERINKEIAAN